MKLLLISLILFLSLSSTAQFQDTFSDGDLTNNPSWSGDLPRFTVSSSRMKLQAPALAESAFLITPSQAIHAASWEFYLQMDFTPSSTNFAKIYLVSDQSNLAGPLNGYFIKAGNTSRDVSLYRQSGTSETRIIDGIDDRLNLATPKLKIRITRSAIGLWQLFTDIGPTGNYSFEGEVTDMNITASEYFGVQCIYTSTRSDKFWFDDFFVTGTPVPDTTPPQVLSQTTINEKQINLLFSEPVDPVSAQDLSHYSISGGQRIINSILKADRRTVELYFSNPLVNGVSNDLTISEIKDLKGNIMSSIVVKVLYFVPTVATNKNIIITEIFADPSPQIGLPAAEYIEIYNRSQVPFNLLGWKFSDASSTGIFPDHILLPGEYRVITSSSAASLFSTGTVIGLTNFPTLNNGGEYLILRSATNITIDSVNFNLDWYRDVDKSEGGWSLELIDPNNPCGEQDNWTASENQMGGTPGKINSVFANKPDLTPPELISAFATSASGVTLSFSEKLSKDAVVTALFSIIPDVGDMKPRFSDYTLTNIILTTVSGILRGQTYTLSLHGVADCAGNVMGDKTFRFGLCEPADSLDVKINEVLFNPRTGGVDFVEVFNSSSKFLNLKSWKLSNFNNGGPSGTVSLFQKDLVINPGAFTVFTTSPSVILQQYPGGVASSLYKTSLPSLPDDEGSVAIISDSGKILDALKYSKDWHSVFIQNDDGVSLERISIDGPTNDKNNWSSASSITGYATPGYMNSQSCKTGKSENPIKVNPEVFSPGQGYNDFVLIQYQFETSGLVANVKVFDPVGHLLKTLATNEILGSDGFFRWDGYREDGSRARVGYYVVWFETFSASGEVQTFRKRVILAPH